MDKILFDIYLNYTYWGITNDEGYGNINVTDNNDTTNYNFDTFFKGLPCPIRGRARFRYKNMRCWIDNEFLLSIVGYILKSVVPVFEGKYYFCGYSEIEAPFDVVFQSYEEDKIMIYLAADEINVGPLHNEFVFNEKYNIMMRPIPRLYQEKKNGFLRKIADTHNIVIMPKIEFYKVAYEGILRMKEFFKKIGYEEQFHTYEDLSLIREQLIGYGVIFD